ncbi:hypothetical protein Poly30_50880 [Planctomycetes bacterium Poly30]|uniref:Uncharacterized protein n=2 Tax=Saltatorellus ferox TaxID=2528018 RepID=A0A518EZL8_9BACT|nr:hypothetical protein Poly30_50880 [Planctomycetes bacterium Poly30]
MLFIRCALALMVCLGAMTASTAAPQATGIGSEIAAVALDDGSLDAPSHPATPLEGRDASSEEEEERDDDVASGDVEVAGGESLQPAVRRALEDCEGIAPSAVRCCLDARGPPAR